MTPELQHEKDRLFDEAEAHFAAQVRFTHGPPRPKMFAETWLEKLYDIRRREREVAANPDQSEIRPLRG